MLSRKTEKDENGEIAISIDSRKKKCLTNFSSLINNFLPHRRWKSFSLKIVLMFLRGFSLDVVFEVLSLWDWQDAHKKSPETGKNECVFAAKLNWISWTLQSRVYVSRYRDSNQTQTKTRLRRLSIQWTLNYY